MEGDQSDEIFDEFPSDEVSYRMNYRRIRLEHFFRTSKSWAFLMNIISGR